MQKSHKPRLPLTKPSHTADRRHKDLALSSDTVARRNNATSLSAYPTAQQHAFHVSGVANPLQKWKLELGELFWKSTLPF